MAEKPSQPIRALSQGSFIRHAQDVSEHMPADFEMRFFKHEVATGIYAGFIVGTIGGIGVGVVVGIATVILEAKVIPFAVAGWERRIQPTLDALGSRMQLRRSIPAITQKTQG